MSELDPEIAKSAGFRFFPKRMVFTNTSVRVMRVLSGVMKPPADTTGLDIERFPVAGSDKDVIVYRRPSESPLPVVFWIHGGGFVLGTNDQAGWGATFASHLPVALVSAGYRLAPENPFPAALDDLRTAIDWLSTDGADLDLDPTRVCVAGESAGGGLAASLVQRLADEGVEVAGQLLVYPMLDDRTATRPEHGAKDHMIWTNGSNRHGWSSYLGRAPGAETVPPYAVPGRREDLAGLPPTWIGVGDLDLFWDEDHAYAERLAECGVECRLETFPGAPHGFPSMAPDAAVSRKLVESAQGFVADVLLP